MSLLVFLLLLGAPLMARGSQTCYVSGDDYCSCTTGGENAVTLDLRHIGLTYPVSREFEDYVYIYTPCQSISCGKSAGVLCQDAVGKELEFMLGRYSEFSWQVTNDDPDSLQFELHYGGGEKDKGVARQAVVNFMKGSEDTQFIFSHQDSLIYYFNVTGSGIAPYRGGSSSSSDTGDISGPIGLSIIFLALGGLVVYFVVGGIFMYTQRGARGVEVIPNYSFWKDFPFLIKDGFFFTISPCYKNRDDYRVL